MTEQNSTLKQDFKKDTSHTHESVLDNDPSAEKAEEKPKTTTVTQCTSSTL